MRGRVGVPIRRGQRANRGRGQRANRGRRQVPRGLVAEAWADFNNQLSEDDEGTSKRIKST